MKSRMPPGYNSGMNNPMKQMQKMQEEIQKSKEELEQKEFIVTSGGGMVEVVISGKKEITGIKMKPEVVDPDDVEMLGDLIISAVNEAIRKVEEASESDMERITGGLSIPGMPF
ncbi:MAG: YbaB/EbfC family nucleoid-associated protein [Oscillospiraceae bacterium]|nr:YbaB/EbfC family nucleoid-associated protein [Oscillospiraceae bacterium]